MKVDTFVLLLVVTKYCEGKRIARIQGGRDARPGKFPYVVRLEVLYYHNSQQNHLCTGTAIAPTWTITAAHCLDISRDSLEDYKLIINYSAVSRAPQPNDPFVDVISWFMHPTFSFEGIISFNDVGLIKSQPMMLAQYGKISAVHYKTLVGLEVITAGYGLMLVNDTEISSHKVGVTRDVMKPLQLANFVIKKCKYLDLQPLLCLSPACDRDYFLCPGDSGGPTIHHSGVIAVSSKGGRTSSCLQPYENHSKRRSFNLKDIQGTGMIAPLSPHLDWIKETIVKN